jgi:hypothetical protein
MRLMLTYIRACDHNDSGNSIEKEKGTCPRASHIENV